MLSPTKMLAALLAVALLVPIGADAAEKKKEPSDLQKGYQLAKKRCLSCHDSVANPEAGRKTRDEWHVVMSVMHKQFKVQLSNQEQELLTDYFYTIRKGLEKEPG